ncbi:MAG: pantoate--beta-alanine ligase [SAR324 cluster bacterium]|nr:pantoate--beta-alanine ligase [SAR324 cluster bacterium]
MIIAKEISEVQGFLGANRSKTKGFVPTMGFLHKGHLSLVKKSKSENELTLASIFVNPTQFNQASDLDSYPRDEKRDLELLEAAGVDLFFFPTADIIYPKGFNTKVEVLGVTEELEGATRPGHFAGVALVVAKLFNICQPTNAYFGNKDYQQVAVIKQLTKDLNFPIQIHACPTFRSESGLALSSRNARLSSQQLDEAPLLYEALRWGRDEIKSGILDLKKVKAQMEAIILKSKFANIEYIAFSDATTLVPLNVATQGQELLISLAVYFGDAPLKEISSVRLIDNILVTA